MTKKKLAKRTIEIIDNYRFDNKPEEVIVEAIENLFNVLEPKDKKQFAKWGYPDDKSTVEECWE